MEASSEDDSDIYYYTKKKKSSLSSECNQTKANSSKYNNAVQKLFNRELFGTTTRQKRPKNEKFFDKIPPRLRYCLIDIVPKDIITNHIFMGFTQCGTYLLSFTYNHTMAVSPGDIRFDVKFRLHFLLWVPGRNVKPVHSIPIFDNDPVESRVDVSMAQWKHNPNLLVVYGIAKSSTDRSYLSVIGVPKLGCKKCAAFSNQDDGLALGNRCLEHNFAIHTKFYCTSDSNMFEPVIQLAYANQIIIYTDFIHILDIDYVKQDSTVESHEDNEQNNIVTNTSSFTNPCTHYAESFASCSIPQSNVVQKILADFADLEMENSPITKPVKIPDVMGQELCIQASLSQSLIEEWEGPSPSIRTLISPPLRSPRRRPVEGMSRFNESYRKIAEKTYEFVEEPEPKCEKLSIFRKRRLADKKYEFSEDNNENIVPFRVLRSNRKYYIGSNNKNPKRPKSPSVESVVLRDHKQINVSCSSPTTSNEDKSYCLDTMEQDDRSEPEYRIMAVLEDGTLKTVSVHDNTSKTLSDCVINPQDPYLVHSGNSKCTKFFTSYFVESDDEITSIITDSEDDCLSGYHVALPLTAHGAAYAPLQPIGQSAWERLNSSNTLPQLTLKAQQRSLDMELLCNEVCGRLCKLKGMKFIYCFDWGCHVIDVCQSSGCLCGLCAMWFWASDSEEMREPECVNCKATSSGCLLHRQQYTAECLFIWDLVSGVYRTERVSMIEDSSQEGKRVSGADRARELATKFVTMNNTPGSDYRLLTTLTGRSLQRLTDIDNCIEITKRHPDSSESEYESDGSDSDWQM